MQQKTKNEGKQDKINHSGDGESDENIELQKLKKENKKLKKKIKGLKATIKITSKHGDATAEKLEQALDAMPVPVVITVRADGRILHVNHRACIIFGFSYEEFLKRTTQESYANPEERKEFLKIFTKNGKVNEFEIRLKKSDDSHFSASSSESIDFMGESCLGNSGDTSLIFLFFNKFTITGVPVSRPLLKHFFLNFEKTL